MKNQLEETPMKSTVLVTASLLAIGLLFAGSAQAAEALDDAACDAAWTMASPNGETISKDDVMPYVIDYTMVDSDADGKVSADEFKKGCAAGAVKAADDATVKDMESAE
jgi:hypothetical protein